GVEFFSDDAECTKSGIQIWKLLDEIVDQQQVDQRQANLFEEGDWIDTGWCGRDVLQRGIDGLRLVDEIGQLVQSWNVSERLKSSDSRIHFCRESAELWRQRCDFPRQARKQRAECRLVRHAGLQRCQCQDQMPRQCA